MSLSPGRIISDNQNCQFIDSKNSAKYQLSKSRIYIYKNKMLGPSGEKPPPSELEFRRLIPDPSI